MGPGQVSAAGVCPTHSFSVQGKQSSSSHNTYLVSIHHLHLSTSTHYLQYLHASEDEVVPPGECQPGPQQRGGWCHRPAQTCKLSHLLLRVILLLRVVFLLNLHHHPLPVPELRAGAGGGGAGAAVQHGGGVRHRLQQAELHHHQPVQASEM